MKKLIIIISLFSLSGCASLQGLYDSYFMAKYDTNENMLINRLAIHSDISKDFCSDKMQAAISSGHLYIMSKELIGFSKSLPDNEATIKMITPLHKMVEEFYNHYKNGTPVNKTYCELKLQSITDASTTIQKVIVKRPRS